MAGTGLQNLTGAAGFMGSDDSGKSFRCWAGRGKIHGDYHDAPHLGSIRA